ncbi:MAG TPA: PAS domain S-box protein [Spirochaetota bacterium]|nr:PAS domain S-box protein [Spirochaetota bacterium]
MRDPFPDLKLFAEQADFACLMLDEDLKIIWFNDELVKLTGLARDRLLAMSWDDLVTNGYPATPVEQKFSPLKNGSVASGKFWCSLKNKIPRKILSATIAYHRDKKLYSVTLYDITHQLTPQQLVTDGGLFVGAIVDNLKGSMAFHDNFGFIKFASQEICNLVGVKKSDILEHHIKEFFDEELVDRWLNFMNNNPDKIPPYLEFNSSKKGDGRAYHVMAAPRLFMDYNRKVIGCMFIFSDITLLKMNEERLRISDEKYSKAFYANPAPSSITTLEEGRYIDVNESYVNFVGYSKDELIGKTTMDINFFIDEDDRKKFVQELTKTGKLRNYETRIYSRIKGIRTFSLSAEIIELQGKKCIVWVGYDVTDEINLEKEVLQATGRERYRIGQYLHDDLGQHLVGVEAMVTLLENRLKNQGSSEVPLVQDIHDYVKEAHEKARSMASGLCPVRLEENGLSSAIEDLANQTEKIFGIHCIFINLNRSEKIYNSQIAINMYYIVQEAVNNAIRHSNAEEISITYFSNDDNIYLSVEDNGCGFEPSANDSEGMGLSIMRYRARAIGGSLEIKSKPGMGTYILLKFPRINNRKNEWDWRSDELKKIEGLYS